MWLLLPNEFWELTFDIDAFILKKSNGRQEASVLLLSPELTIGKPRLSQLQVAFIQEPGESSAHKKTHTIRNHLNFTMRRSVYWAGEIYILLIMF